MFHVLDHPALRDAFVRHDAQANRAKRSGRNAGIFAIFLGCCALFAASAEHLLEGAGDIHLERLVGWHSARWAALVASHAPSIQETVAAVAALAGLASVFIGAMGVLHASRKREWLQERLTTESLRQFHFKSLVFHLPEILLSIGDPAVRIQLLFDRDRSFEALMANLEGRPGTILTKILRDGDDGFEIPVSRPADVASALESKELAPLFDAYQKLRIEHQESYALTKLNDDNSVFSKYPKRQSEVFSLISLLSIVGLFVIHFGVVLSTLLPSMVTPAFRSDIATVGVIWLAVGALGIRALEAGFQPEREVERYQAYRSAVSAILRRYKADGSGIEKHRVMMEMEQLSFDEMRNFLITNNRSRFVI
jgi:hypothetical protein